MSSNMQLSDLPEGTVTFLFTDIEGSTQLLSQLRDQYATLLSDQRRILREYFARWNGQFQHILSTMEDFYSWRGQAQLGS